MMNRLRSSRPFTVVVATIALFTSMSLYGIDFARRDTYSYYSETYKHEDIGDMSFMAGVLSSSAILVWKFDLLDLAKFRRLASVASLVLAFTVLPNYLLYQQPGVAFNFLRTIQGGLTGVLSTASLLSAANTAGNSEIWWTLLLPCSALSLAGGVGITFTRSFDTLKLMPYMAMSFLFVSAGMLPVQQNRYSSLAEKEIDPVLFEPEDGHTISPLKQVPNLLANLCRALIICYQISDAPFKALGSMWDFHIPDDAWDDMAGGPGPDTIEDEIVREFLEALANIAFILFSVGGVLFYEILGTFINKRLGKACYTFVVLLFGLPHVIVFYSDAKEPGGFIELLTACCTILVFFMVAVLTPLVARLANTSYGLGNATRGKVFALFMGVFAVGHIIKIWVTPILDSPIEHEELGGLVLIYFCYIACDFVPEITPRIVKKLKKA